jgi:hypothetical protein
MLYNFKIAAKPQEPLFVSMGFDEAKNELISKGLKAKKQDSGFFGENESYDFRGLDKLQYLKQVNSPADLITIYGSVGARKTRRYDSVRRYFIRLRAGESGEAERRFRSDFTHRGKRAVPGGDRSRAPGSSWRTCKGTGAGCREEG